MSTMIFRARYIPCGSRYGNATTPRAEFGSVWGKVLLHCLLLFGVGMLSAKVSGADGVFSNWMRDRFPLIKDKKLGALVIPGTHDSGTYALIDIWDATDPRNLELLVGDVGAPDKPAEARVALALGGSIAKGWGAAQSRNITQQLEDGIRSLDLRVAVDKKGVFRACHALYGDRLDKILDDVKQFSDAHPQEILILSFWAFHDWAEDMPGKMRPEKHTALINMIESRFTNRIANLNSLTPENRVSAFVNAGKTIIIAYGSENAGDEDSQDREGAWTLYGKSHGYWVRNDGMNFPGTNAGYTNGRQDGITKMSSGRIINGKGLFDTSGVSASGELVGRGLDPAATYPHNLKAVAHDVTPVIVSWLHERNPDNSFVWASPNVVSLDHYDQSCLVKICLERNGIPAIDIAQCDLSGQTQWGKWQQGYEIVDAWTSTAVKDVGGWFTQAYTDVAQFFTSLSQGIVNVFTRTYPAPSAGIPPSGGVEPGVRHYVITAQRIEVIAAPADWEGDLELYGQILMVPSPFAFTDPGANETLWSLPEGDQGRTKIGASLIINNSKNIYVREADARGLQVAIGAVLYDDEFGLFAGVGDHLLELDKTLRSGPLTFDLGSLAEGDSVSEKVEYVKPNIARVAVYFTATRLVAPVIPKVPPVEWVENFRSTVSVDRLTTMGAGLLKANAGVPGRIEYLPPVGSFLVPGSDLEVQARFIPADIRNYSERVITRRVLVPRVNRPIPGRIEAEGFDSFFAAGGSIATEPTSDTGGGFDVKSPQAGTWTAYQILVPSDSSYILRLRVATATANQRLQIQVDGHNLSEPVLIPNTGGVQSWQTITLPTAFLNAGFHQVQVGWLTGGVSLNYLQVNFPDSDVYAQNFDSLSNGATSLQDGSTLSSTDFGLATRVLNGVLRLTDDSKVSTTATLLLPPLSTNGLPTFVGFEASFDYKRSSLFAPEIFSFRYGNLSVQLDDATHFKTVVVSVGGQVLPGGAPSAPLLNENAFNPVKIRWSKQSGTGRLTVVINGVTVIAELATPGFDPGRVDTMSIVVKNLSALAATVEIDNVRIAKLPPETRVLTASIGSVNGSLIDLGTLSIPYSLLNEGNAPITILAMERSDGAASGVDSFVLGPGESRDLALYWAYRGDGQYHLTLKVYSDATAGVDWQGAQTLEFDAYIAGTPSGGRLIARFPLDNDGNSADGRFVASEMDDVVFGAAGARLDSGGAAVFNGKSSRIQHAWNALFNPGTANTAGSFTVTVWARPAVADNAHHSVISSRHDKNPDSSGYILYDNGDNNWEYRTGNGTGVDNWQLLDGPRARVGAWQHLALVYDAQRQRKTLFVDGEPVHSQDTVVAPNLDRPFNIGAGGDFGHEFFFNGLIDDLGIFEGALTRSEIARVMAGDYTPFEPPPGDRMVLPLSGNLGTLEIVDGKIVGRFTLINPGTATVTIRKFILPPGVSLDWTGGKLAPQQTREILVTKEVTAPGPVYWQVVANSDANASVDTSGNTYYTLSAVAIEAPVFIVTTTADSGAGSLRRVLADAAAHPGADFVRFAPGFTGPINLNSEIIINDLSSVTVDANSIDTGVTIRALGAHRLFHISPGTIAAFQRLILTGGSVGGGYPDSYGGAVFVDGALTLTGCTVSQNSAFAGGGIFVANSSTASLTINRSSIARNAAYYGGGIQNEGTLLCSSSTLALNTAIVEGGAISSVGNNLTLIQTTVASNASSGRGGGIKGGEIAIHNSILAGNAAPTDPNISGTLIATGANITGGDPKLAPLDKNGGPTETMALLPNSPALGAGAGGGAGFDQRGLPIVDLPDIGAFEAQSGTLHPLSIHLSGINVAVSWDVEVGVHLERTDRLAPGAVWVTVPFNTIGNRSSASFVSSDSRTTFFRLRREQ